MTNTEILHQKESQDWFKQHEFWKMIETPTAKAILVNEKYDAWEMPHWNEEVVIWLRQNITWRIEKAFEDIDMPKKVSHNLLPSLSSFILKWNQEGLVLWSWWFIRPNVIVSAAHVIRNSKTWEIRPMYDVTDGNGNEYKVKAIYFNKVHTEDIAFIVTEEENTWYVDLYNKGVSQWEDIITLWMSQVKPRFTKGKQWLSWYQSFYGTLWKNISKSFDDRDNDGILDIDEYLPSDNKVLSWDSWWLVVSETWELKWITSQWWELWRIHTWAYIEPHSKIVKQYGDFMQAMTKLWVEIK